MPKLFCSAGYVSFEQIYCKGLFSEGLFSDVIVLGEAAVGLGAVFNIKCMSDVLQQCFRDLHHFFIGSNSVSH